VFTEVISSIKLIFPVKDGMLSDPESVKHVATELCAPVAEIGYSLVQFYLT